MRLMHAFSVPDDHLGANPVTDFQIAVSQKLRFYRNWLGHRSSESKRINVYRIDCLADS